MWENIDYDPFHISSALKSLQSFILRRFFNLYGGVCLEPNIQWFVPYLAINIQALGTI